MIWVQNFEEEEEEKKKQSGNRSGKNPIKQYRSQSMEATYMEMEHRIHLEIKYKNICHFILSLGLINIPLHIL